jgi:Tol biopolymer transport system component
MTRKATAMVGVAAALALALPSSGAPTPPSSDGLIAFVTRGLPSSGVAVIRPDGSGIRMVTHDFHDRSPAWSPSGRFLAFERAGALYVIKADGTGLRRLGHHTLPEHHPAWSPDGRLIAFVTQHALFTMRASGTGVRRLLRVGAKAWVHQPSWSPDGRWIAFSRLVWLCERCDQEEIFSSDAEGNDVRWVTTDTSFEASNPSWSPDGKRSVAETSNGIAILDQAGTQLRVLVPRTIGGLEPAWQPHLVQPARLDEAQFRRKVLQIDSRGAEIRTRDL